MMFRNTQEEEESASDWDDLTPNTTPQHRPKSPPHPTPSPHNASPSPTNPFSAATPNFEERSVLREPGPSDPQEVKPSDSNGVEFVSLADQAIIQQPRTPPNTHPAYTVVTAHTPPAIAPANREHVPPRHSASDPHLETSPPLSCQHDTLQTPHLPLKSGDFAFKGITNTLQVHVEKEKEVEYAVMPRYADRCEKISHRIFQEFFSILRLCTDLVITFVLECAHYLAFHILRKLCCGLLFIFLSALAAPGLTDCYNTVMWPVALFCLQVCRAGQMVVAPCVECLGWGAGRCVDLVSACRPVQIHYPTPHGQRISHTRQFV